MMGRITNGGFNMRSKPVLAAASGVGLGEPGVGLAVGEKDVSGDGDGEVSGVTVAVGACRSKLAHGMGGTLAHRW